MSRCVTARRRVGPRPALTRLPRDRDAGDLGEAVGQEAGVGVVVREAVDVVVEGVEAGGGDDAGLAHGAAELMLHTPGLGDEVAGSGQDSADGGAEAFAEVDPDRVELGGELERRDAGGDDGVHEAGAVHVHRESVAARDLGDLRDAREGPDRAAAHVRGLLDGDDARAGVMIDVARADGGLDLLGGDDAALAVERADLGAGQRGRAGDLVVTGVGAAGGSGGGS